VKKRKTFVLTVIAAGAIMLIISWFAGRIISKKYYFSHNNTYNEEGMLIDSVNHPYYSKRQWGYFYKIPRTIRYYSDITGTERKAMVFLPAGYSENKSYPVLYLLHGYGGRHSTWRNKNAHIIIQNLIYFEDVPEMIVVCPDCVVSRNEEDRDAGFYETIRYFDLTEREIIDNLMPYVEEHFNVLTGRKNTAIAGNSMGGRNSLAIGFKNQDKFGYIGAFSSVSPLPDERHSGGIPALLDELKLDSSQFEFLMLSVGKSDNVCGDVTYALHEYMTGRGINHVFYDVDGEHENKVWQNSLYNFCKNIFNQE
jgi:enterochelin esterase-like enzyme